VTFILGTANFGSEYGLINKHNVSNKEVIKILKIAKKNNVNIIDTADLYGNSENLIANNNLLDFEIITKISFGTNEIDQFEKYINNFVESRLKKFNKNYIYGLLLHKPEEIYLNKKKLLKIFDKLKNEKLIKLTGSSIYYDSQIDLELKDFYNIIQIPLNIFDQRFLISDKILKLKENGILLHARSIFLNGLLLKKRKNLHNHFLKWDKLFIDFNEWLNKNEVEAIDACINFVKKQSIIDNIVVGFENSEQLIRIFNFVKNKSIKFPSYFRQNDLDLLIPMNWKI